jgi:hypothetical protein
MSTQRGNAKPVNRRSAEYRTVRAYVQQKVGPVEYKAILLALLKEPPMTPDEASTAIFNHLDELSRDTCIGWVFHEAGHSEPMIEMVCEHYANLSVFDYRLVEAVLNDLVDSHYTAQTAARYAEKALPMMKKEVSRIIDGLDLRTQCIIAAVVHLRGLNSCGVKAIADEWPIGDLDLDFVLSNAEAFRDDKDLTTLVRAASLAADVFAGS